ncbi:MAG: 4-hydroxy-tetrahydrodipicolinate synthase [Actinomycetales bacterium]|nr:4-hydroxy-tetrahydrodipicolinate synthase [Actinomycetales bacterium]
MPAADPRRPFGELLTAMVSPFTAAGDLDLEAASRLAQRLFGQGHDGLVVNGTTGESPTTSDAEKSELIRAVVARAAGERHVLAGVGTNHTRHSIELAHAAKEAGATGLLVVTPYYNRPPQTGLIAHFTAIADATDLPVMLYDIPGRTGVAIEPETFAVLAEHPRIVANKDAKGDVAAATQVMAATGLAWYSGDDHLTLQLLRRGAVGVVSVVGHVVGARLREMIDAHHNGDAERAQAVNEGLQPVYTGMFRTQGVILTKAALALLGEPVGGLRLPMVEATEQQIEQLRADLRAAGVTV